MNPPPIFEENWYIEAVKEYGKPSDFTKWIITTVPSSKYIFVKRSAERPSDEEFIEAIKLKLKSLNKFTSNLVITKRAGTTLFDVSNKS